ncbi:MAG: hypothetical protein R3C19_13500 [Planctomycetaceae bacterium]
MPTLKHTIGVFASAILLLLSSTDCSAQATGTSPVYQLQPGDNQIAIYERFTTIIQHSANIKSVLDFDADVIKIDVVQGNPQQVRVYALATGVTTVTIMDEYDQYYKVEVLVRGDVRHLESYLKRRYPNDAVQVEEIKGAVLLSGFVTQPDHINEIVAVAEQFYPSVLNHMRIGGVQQVMLKCKVLEVQRSKIRRFGFNFDILKDSSYLVSTPGPITPVTGLNVTSAGPTLTLGGLADPTLSFGFINANSIFEGYLKALREEGLLKIHATPMLVTHNGQPAHLLNGGETPVIVPAGLGTTAIQFKEFGVVLDAVPHILGNGRVRQQIEATVSERDFSNAVTVNGVTVPAFTTRTVSTQVEMNFGETLVIAGLISQREDAATSKIPFVGELPWIGSAFSRKQYTESETELIILVTPEYVAPMSPEEVPPYGPGQFTDAPTDHELFFHNMIELPKYGDDCQGCINCLQNGSCPQHPNGCRPGAAADCVQKTPSGSTLIQPAANTAASGTPSTVRPSVMTPASFSGSQSPTAGRQSGQAQQGFGSSGLISPVMR